MRAVFDAAKIQREERRPFLPSRIVPRHVATATDMLINSSLNICVRRHRDGSGGTAGLLRWRTPFTGTCRFNGESFLLERIINLVAVFPLC